MRLPLPPQPLMRASLCLLFALAPACGSSSGSSGGEKPDTATADTADTAAGQDAAQPDTSSANDAGAVDASPAADAGGATDAGPTDVGAAKDAGAPMDAGATDAGPMDAGPMDAGPMDAGATDAGPTDAGPMDAGVDKDAGPNGCSLEQGCAKPGQMCFAPGESIGCGICMKPEKTCQSDADCPSNGVAQICLYKKTDCTCGGEKLCHDGCTADKDCTGLGEVCGADHHCKPAPCADDADCPTFAFCADKAGIKGCLRKSCKASSQCGAGYCVKGLCYPAPGFCSMLPP